MRRSFVKWILISAVFLCFVFVFGYLFRGFFFPSFSLVQETRGAIFVDNLDGYESKYWSYWIQDKGLTPSFSDGQLHIAGTSTLETMSVPNYHVGYESTFFEVVSDTVLEVTMTDDGGGADTVFHLCGHDSKQPDSYPDYWFEVVVAKEQYFIGYVNEQGLFSNRGHRAVHCGHFFCSSTPHSYKIKWDYEKGQCEGFVQGMKGWVSLGSGIIPLKKIKIELKSVTYDKGFERRISYDNLRLYPDPKRSPVTFRFDADNCRDKQIGLYRYDGTLIQQFDRSVQRDYQVYLDGYIDSFPTSIFLLIDSETGTERIDVVSRGVEGVYPGDTWVLK